MSIRKTVVRILSLLLVCMLCMACTGCKGSNNSTAKPTWDATNVSEWWAFDPSDDGPALIVRKDGTASYKGVEYKKCEVTDNMYKLTDDKGAVLELEYKDTENGNRYIYDIWEYDRTDGAKGPSVVGVWESGNNYYEFTAKGTFQEDGVFFGHYSVDVNAGTIRLMYERDLADTLMYYHIENDHMTVRYPFIMYRFEQ